LTRLHDDNLTLTRLYRDNLYRHYTLKSSYKNNLSLTYPKRQKDPLQSIVFH
jgi:hypothetical protein